MGVGSRFCTYQCPTAATVLSQASVASARQGLRAYEVPVTVREMTDEEESVFALIENLQREDLNAVEEAEGIKTLSTPSASLRNRRLKSSENRARRLQISLSGF